MFVYMLARATLFCQHSASNLLCLCLCPVQTLQKICFTYFILRPILKETLHRSLHLTTIDLQLAEAVECCCFQYFHLESCCSTAGAGAKRLFQYFFKLFSIFPQYILNISSETINLKYFHILKTNIS